MIHTFRPGTNGRTILVCHGTGGDENSLTWLAEVLDPEAAILSPRGNVSEGGMPRFFRRFAEGVFDLEDVTFRANELADFVSLAIERYELDAQSIVGVGYSNGANILSQTMLLRPESLSQLVLLRAMVVLEEVGQPDLSGKRVWISDGVRDPIVPTENAERFAAQLKGFGADVTLNWHNGGHELGREEIELAKAWL